MIQFAGNTFYLIGALLCYIILPAVTRANNIWNGRPFEKNEGLFLKDTAAMIETNRSMSDTLRLVELSNAEKTIPSKMTSNTRLPSGPRTGPCMPVAWNMN